MALHQAIARVTDRIRERSQPSRDPYLARMAQAVAAGPARSHLSCGNQAHAYAAMGSDKNALTSTRGPPSLRATTRVRIRTALTRAREQPGAKAPRARGQPGAKAPRARGQSGAAEQRRKKEVFEFEPL